MNETVRDRRTESRLNRTVLLIFLFLSTTVLSYFFDGTKLHFLFTPRGRALRSQPVFLFHFHKRVWWSWWHQHKNFMRLTSSFRGVSPGCVGGCCPPPLLLPANFCPFLALFRRLTCTALISSSGKQGLQQDEINCSWCKAKGMIYCGPESSQCSFNSRAWDLKTCDCRLNYLWARGTASFKHKQAFVFSSVPQSRIS